MERPPLAVRLCLALLRIFSALVPASCRGDWRREWEAEIHHRWRRPARRHPLDWRAEMHLVRDVFGALPDAAWLRRQLTTDAELVHDVRHGARMLRTAPAFTLSAVVVLSLGIAGCVALASVLDTLIFRPLPYQEAERIVTLWQRGASAGGQRGDVAPANFLDWRERARTLETISAVIPYSFDFTGGGEPEVLFGAQVTEGFWQSMGTAPALGRPFLPEEHVRGGRRVALISHGLWRRKFGADPAVVNRSISLDGDAWTIVGVLPPDFAPQLLMRPGDLEVWTPKVIQPHEQRIRGSAWWKVVARLRPGVSVEGAAAELNAISAALAREHPRTNAGVTAQVIPLREHLMGDLKRPLILMFGAVVIVLAMGCANVASLMLARGLHREREFAIRSALGAGRFRIVRQMVAESLLLASIAAVCGIAAAHWAIRLIVAFAPGGVVRLQDAGVDVRMLALAAGVTLVTALAFGLVPAVQFSRSRDPLRERNATVARTPLRRLLVTAEIALAVVLLTGAGLLIRSFTRLMAVDPGFSPSGVIAAQVFADDRHGTADRARAFFDAAIERLRALPGVDAAGAVSAMPFMIANIDIQSPIRLGSAEAPPETSRRSAYLTIATPGYFQAMSIPLKEGRYLGATDSAQGRPVAVISDSLRRREWPAGSPIGARIHAQWQGRPLALEVVGVVGEIRHDGLDSPPRPEIFVPHAQVPFTSMTFVLRGQTDPDALLAAVKREVWALDPLQTFYDTASVERQVRASAARQRFSATLMAGFATLALVLCATGIYGLVSFTTLQRTREIGVRMALGADDLTIRRMVLRDGGRLVLGGVAAGVAAAAAASRALGALLFEVHPSDPATLAAVSGLLIAVGIAACYVPARRATRVDPLIALRADP